MDAPDDRTKEILEVREHLARKAEEHEAELEYIRRTIAILDSLLKKSSFARASDLKRGEPEAQAAPEAGAAPEAEPEAVAGAAPEAGGAIPIMAGGRAVAHATVAGGEVRIRVADGVRLTVDTPPWKVFFLERIVGGMKKKDEALVAAGGLDAGSVISCGVEEDAGALREIVVRNCRDGERSEEIVNSVSWVLARMAENSAG